MKLDIFKNTNHPLVVVTLNALEKLFKEWAALPVNEFTNACTDDILNLEKLSVKHSLDIKIPKIFVKSEKISISSGLGATVFGANANKPAIEADIEHSDTPRAARK